MQLSTQLFLATEIPLGSHFVGRKSSIEISPPGSSILSNPLSVKSAQAPGICVCFPSPMPLRCFASTDNEKSAASRLFNWKQSWCEDDLYAQGAWLESKYHEIEKSLWKHGARLPGSKRKRPAAPRSETVERGFQSRLRARHQTQNSVIGPNGR